MKPIYLALIFALVSNAIANILIKEGMKDKALGFTDKLALIKGIAFNPTVVIGVLFFGLALGAYSFALTKLKLSVAYPIMTTTGFLIVVSYSFFKLQEQITTLQIAGLALILVGVWMVASNMS